MGAFLLFWNGIVKDESARIRRCIASLLPHVDGAIVLDTGSTDDTPKLIKEAFQAANKPVRIHYAKFRDFAQARNEALQAARVSHYPWTHLLLCDADMQLVVEKPNWLNGATGASYDMQQRVGDLVYWNRRVLSRSAIAHAAYKCPTHEYLNVDSAGQIHGAYFIDHADGANRKDKYDRDIKLLTEALLTETDPGMIQRIHFYLAQTFFDKGDWQNAADHYAKRVTLGGWDEERWNAQLKYAHCLAKQGDAKGFLWETLVAYEMRPTRGESLYDLARFFREIPGAPLRSLLFSEPGL